ncbi:MAG: bifunctional adenosylcobinamide kinase/adenosylcobinamide-phosphate guanylyltransferase [Bacteroidota bacterium]
MSSSSRIYYISGGERSGKSSYAERLALSLSDNPVYLATARIWDNDFAERVARHQHDRDGRWKNVEEEIALSTAISPGEVVLIDCVTLWLTNIFMAHKSDRDQSFTAAKEELEKLWPIDSKLIFVSNEIGMGLHADSKMGRDFVELQGWTNQLIARKSDEAYFMVSGLPMKLK